MAKKTVAERLREIQKGDSCDVAGIEAVCADVDQESTSDAGEAKQVAAALLGSLLERVRSNGSSAPLARELHAILQLYAICPPRQGSEELLATVKGVHIEGVRLSGKHLSHIVFEKCVFDEGELHELFISDATFSACYFNQTKFTDVTMVHVDLSGSTFVANTMVGDRFSGVNLSGATFMQCRLARCSLALVNPMEARWFATGGRELKTLEELERWLEPGESRLERLRIEGAKHLDMPGDRADPHQAVFVGVQVIDEIFDGLKSEEARFTMSHIVESSFRHTVLGKSIWQLCSIENCSFEFGHLVDARFGMSRIENSSFRHAILRDAGFKGCSFTGSTFAGADLRGARFRECDLLSVDFRGANIEGVMVRDCTISITEVKARTGLS